MKKLIILTMVAAVIAIFSLGTGSALAAKFSKNACAWLMFPAYGTPPYQALCVDWDGPTLPGDL